MTDIVDKKTRSRMMAAIKGKDTRPELLVRRFLHSQGFRYRLHVKKLPGRPDIVLSKYRTMIFVHGCFWHRHTGCRLSYVPTSHKEKWASKFEKNVERDHNNIAAARQAGWRVIILWECGLRRNDPAKLDWLPSKIRSHCDETLIEWPAISC